MDGTLILEGVVGSAAYGLATETSDIDRLGVYVAPTDQVLGLRGRGVVADSYVTRSPDAQYHEIGKYLGMALGCNPTAMELLWLPRWDTQTYEGELLVQLRRDVLSARRIRDAYGGYAVQQARKLQRRVSEGRQGFASDLAKRTAKHGRHCARLLLTGRVLLETGELVVDVSPWRTHLFEMGELAATDPDAFVVEFERELVSLDQAAVHPALPEQPDRERVNEVLVAIRRGLL